MASRTEEELELDMMELEYRLRELKAYNQTALPYIIDCNKTEIDDKNKERDYFAEIKAQKVEVQDWSNRVHYGILENELLMGRLVVSLKTTAEFTRRLVLDLDKLDLEDIDEMIQLNDAFHPLSPKSEQVRAELKLVTEQLLDSKNRNKKAAACLQNLKSSSDCENETHELSEKSKLCRECDDEIARLTKEVENGEKELVEVANQLYDAQTKMMAQATDAPIPSPQISNPQPGRSSDAITTSFAGVSKLPFSGFSTAPAFAAPVFVASVPVAPVPVASVPVAPVPVAPVSVAPVSVAPATIAVPAATAQAPNAQEPFVFAINQPELTETSSTGFDSPNQGSTSGQTASTQFDFTGAFSEGEFDDIDENPDQPKPPEENFFFDAGENDEKNGAFFQPSTSETKKPLF